MKLRFEFLGLFFLSLAVGSSDAAIVLDLDGSTAIIESSKTVLVGTNLSIHAIEDTGLPGVLDRVGIDVYYELASDTAIAVPQLIGVDTNAVPTHTLAGALASTSASGTSTDLFVNTSAIVPGDGLREATLPPSFGFLNSIGGVGYEAVPSINDFQNIGSVGIAEWEFNFPTIGFVTLAVCGILNDSDGSPTMVPGDVYYEIDFGTSFATTCFPPVIVEVVPEPSTSPICLTLFSIGYLRRRLRHPVHQGS